jgi:hypothetical protein
MNTPRDVLAISRRNLLVLVSMILILASALFAFIAKAWSSIGQDPIPPRVTMKMYLSCREVQSLMLFAVCPVLGTFLVAVSVVLWLEWRRLGKIVQAGSVTIKSA